MVFAAALFLSVAGAAVVASAWVGAAVVSAGFLPHPVTMHAASTAAAAHATIRLTISLSILFFIMIPPG